MLSLKVLTWLTPLHEGTLEYSLLHRKQPFTSKENSEILTVHLLQILVTFLLKLGIETVSRWVPTRPNELC